MSDVSPLVARNFRVRFTLLGPRGGRGSEQEVAFSQVVFPALRLDVGKVRVDGDERDLGVIGNLVLRRGHNGSSQLYRWWRAERDRERSRVREVTVVLLDDAHQPVTAWHFTGCHIVSLDFTPLDATDPGVLMESLELSFEHIEQSEVGR